MATIQSKEIIDEMIANDGIYQGDPAPHAIYATKNFYGKEQYVVCYTAADEERMFTTGSALKEATLLWPGRVRQLSNKIHEPDLTGCVMPADAEGQPALVSLAGLQDKFLAIFSTPEKLRAHCAEYSVPYTRIKQIQDGPEFLASLTEQTFKLPYRLRVILDPRTHETGTVRFLEIMLDWRLPNGHYS